jgi:aerobic-type carbon monoxide dehydrogenase small subunit (CoxS/CutS family)
MKRKADDFKPSSFSRKKAFRNHISLCNACEYGNLILAQTLIAEGADKNEIKVTRNYSGSFS